MKTRSAVLTIGLSAALTAAVAALLVSIVEHKQMGRLLEECPCPLESCPHPGRSVK